MHERTSVQHPAGLAGRFALVVAFLAVAGTALADDTGPRQLSEEQRARLEERLTAVRARLDLSEEQKAALEPVLRESFEKRAEVLRSHGVTAESERPSRRETRGLVRDLKAVREETDAEVERILDERQMEEYRKIQAEAQDEMRERFREQRSGE